MLIENMSIVAKNRLFGGIFIEIESKMSVIIQK